ncbi:hypothetical protein EST38_g4823 [Candolleomyces aberdarensis]|uniref:Uncharacterized protein n=1 Tax=Candolleomyces aberdarensis TaxID=2316362 RepID=A0A4Q2DQA3_9AGAR|nr:hypothetical protein EST38_g4823 [Candolleomyces aberdarensis]
MENPNRPRRPVDSLTLEEFCTAAHELHDADRLEDFVHYVLTGICEGRQASIDVILNRIEDDEVQTLGITRDYDSVLGIDKHIRVIGKDITIWPVAKFEDTLKKNIHLSYSFKNARGEYVAPIHQIPNLGLGKWDIHNSLRVLFPDLYSADRKSWSLTKEEQVDFCEKGLLPTLQELLQDRGGDLPPDHRAEMFRARQQSGRLAFGSRVLPADCVTDFGDVLRRNLVAQGVEWAKNLVFLHEIRGVKNTSRHSFDRNNAGAALEEFLDKNGLQLDELGELDGWYVDVGAEVSSNQNRCIVWRTDQHHTLAELVLRIPGEHAERITEVTSSKYYRDLASHLTGVSGFRITPGVRAQGRFETQYFQAYLTDKAITAVKEQNKFGKFITPQQLLNGKGATYINELFHVYRQATEKNFATARFEVRVPIYHAADVLQEIDLNRLCECLLSFPREVWWAFRTWRTLACMYVDDWQRGGESNLRNKNSALLLTAAVSWLLNGLHSTPDLGPSYRDLLSAVLPRTPRSLVERDELPFPITLNMDEDSDDEMEVYELDVGDGPVPSITTRQRMDGEDDDEVESEAGGRTLVPHVPFGVFFFRELCRGKPVPRFFELGLSVSDRSFNFMFGKPRDEILMTLAGNQVSIPRDPTRLHNRTRQRLIEDPDVGERVNFALEHRGHELLPPARDDGSDIAEQDFDDGSEDNDLLASGLDTQLERVWRQYSIDLAKLIPNRQHASDASYCVIPRNQLDNVTPALYQNVNLCDIFDDVQWRLATRVQWERTFSHLWPEKNVKKRGRLQNYGQAAYYRLWETMTSRMSDETAKASRQAIWSFFKTLEWAPCAGAERIWETKTTSSFNRFGVSSGPAPKIYMNRTTPTWNVERPRDVLME